MKKWLFNPFTYIAGLPALLIGFAFMLLTLIGGYYGNLHFNGVIDAHFGISAGFQTYMLEQLVAWACPVLIFYLLALMLSKSNFRFIDIAGTMAVSRAPMLLLSIAAIFLKGYMANVNPLKVDKTLIAVGLLMLLPCIWMIALMYNAFTVSANLKGSKAVTGFIIGLIVAEVISILLQPYIYR